MQNNIAKMKRTQPLSIVYKTLKNMIQKCLKLGVKHIFLFGIVYIKRAHTLILEDNQALMIMLIH